MSETTPKYKKVFELLRKRIESGVYPAGSRMLSEDKLSAEVGAGVITTRQALQELVREGYVTRRRRSGTYVCDRSHPPLLPGRQVRIGVLFAPSIDPQRMRNDFYGLITSALLKALGFPETDPVFEPIPGKEELKMIFQQRDRAITVEGLGSARTSPTRRPPLADVKAGAYDALVCMNIIEEDYLEELSQMNPAMVLVDHRSDRLASRVDQVYVDPAPGIRAVLQHLLNQDIRRFYFVGTKKWQPAASEEISVEEWNRRGKKDRIDPDSFNLLSAFRQELDAHGIWVRDDQVHFVHDNDEDQQALAKKLLAIADDHRPEAVICSSIGVAEHLINAFGEANTPLSAAGLTSSFHFGHALPIRVGTDEFGNTAASLLISRLQQPQRVSMCVGVRAAFAVSGAAQAPTYL